MERMIQARTTLVMAHPVNAIVPTIVTWKSDDPLAVETTFQLADGQITWVFGRDLLLDGLAGPTGDGDVLIQPRSPHPLAPIMDLKFTFRTDDEHQVILHGHEDAFIPLLQDAFRIVPPGQEIDDAALDAWLSSLGPRQPDE